MKETLIDIETYSEVDIGKCGLYRYATDPTFEILLVAWATDDGDGFGETRCADLASGEPFPKELLEDFQSGNVRLIAHNASFERVCFSVHLNRHYPGQYLKPGEFLSPDSWICTMVMAASLTLPMALKDVGTVLKTSQQKDKEGERLIKLFSMPCKPTKSNGMRTRNLPEHNPADWEKFKCYCIQDVNTEVDIYKRLKKFPMPEQEWKHYRVNERINDRGVKIDTELVQQAIACDLMLSDAMSKKAYELTGLENPNSVSQLKSWLDERGIPMDTLGKKDVAQMIEELDKNGVDAEAMDMLKLRLQMAKSSVKKYQAAERCICSDGRARGLFQFYGASRTGRYSGRNIQLQNLPQNHISTLDEARELVRLGCFDMVETIYGNTPDVLSQLIRTMLIPKEGCEFIVADFSAIEARVLAWEATGSLSGRKGHLLCLCQSDVPCAGSKARHQWRASAERKGGRAGLRLWRFFRRTHQHGCSADGSERRGTAGDHRFLAGSQSEDRPVLVGCGEGGNAGIQDRKAAGDRQAGI